MTAALPPGPAAAPSGPVAAAIPCAAASRAQELPGSYLMAMITEPPAPTSCMIRVHQQGGAGLMALRARDN